MYICSRAKLLALPMLFFAVPAPLLPAQETSDSAAPESSRTTFAQTEFERLPWSEEISVRHGNELVVRWSGCVQGRTLFVRAVHEDGWHTYAMDNARRAEEALRGKKSLGIEQGLSIVATSGLKLESDWFQTNPKDLSQPELRWFTFGFDGTAFFACRIAEVTGDQAMVRIRGQACSGSTCCQIDMQLEIPEMSNQAASHPAEPNLTVSSLLKRLTPVRQSKGSQADEPVSPSGT